MTKVRCGIIADRPGFAVLDTSVGAEENPNAAPWWGGMVFPSIERCERYKRSEDYGKLPSHKDPCRYLEMRDNIL